MHRLYQLQNINGSCHYHRSGGGGVCLHTRRSTGRPCLSETDSGEREEGGQGTSGVRTGIYPLSLNTLQWAFESWAKGTPPKEMN